MAKDFETRSITLQSRDSWHFVNAVVSHQFSLDDKRHPNSRMSDAERLGLSDFIQAYANFCMGNETETKPFNLHDMDGHVQHSTDGLPAATDEEAAASIL